MRRAAGGFALDGLDAVRSASHNHLHRKLYSDRSVWEAIRRGYRARLAGPVGPATKIRDHRHYGEVRGRYGRDGTGNVDVSPTRIIRYCNYESAVHALNRARRKEGRRSATDVRSIRFNQRRTTLDVASDQQANGWNQRARKRGR